MADEKDSAALSLDFSHATEAFLLEMEVPNRQHLVDDQDFRLEVRGDREGQPHIHARRITLHRGIDEAIEFGETDNLVELARDLFTRHSQNCAVQKDIFAACKLWMESGAHLQQSRCPAPHPN